ncbi:hypothetical protein CSAL01_11808 [Colletotrichum salicis]|uniref:Clr5 domain-containing protein n=1 Tax=Colletotrichum salicis TaxID=1209931 RepID=A0A135V0R4_9PEZI|nr:hypothetical protein CSAL01_11808 [Colletotrichum salicis]
MFKTRVARWGLDKKLKEEEVMYMVRVKRERQAVGKDSIFRVRDQVVGWGRLEQYLRRRPDLENKRHMQSQGIPDLDIVCRTPSPPPDTRGLTKSVPPLPRRTLSIQIQEDAMRIFAGYHATAFACGVWVLEDENLCEHGFVYLLQAMSNFSGVPTSPEMNRSRDSLRALRRGLFSVRHILQTRDPRFYYAMLVAVLDVEDRFRESAIHFVYKIHDNVLGECHQLSCLWKKMFNLPQDLRLEAVRNMYAIITSHAEAEGASASQYSLDVLRMRCSLLRIRRDVKGNEFQRIISGHATAADHCLGLARYGMFCKALFGLAIAQLDAGEIAEAAGTLSRIGSTVESTYDPSNQS